MVYVIDYACFGFSSSVDALVFSFDGQYTKDAIYKKIERLGLEVVDEEEHNLSTTTSLELPEELPSIEETLMKLSAAFLNRPGLPFYQSKASRSTVKKTVRPWCSRSLLTIRMVTNWFG